MRAIIGVSGLLFLVGGLGIAQQQEHGSDTCGFTIQGESKHATVAGPDDILQLVYVVEQPDSPVEIVSVDLEGMWLSVSGEQHTERDCARYKVHNRSDRMIQRFVIMLNVSTNGGGGGSGAQSSSPLATWPNHRD